MPILNKYGVKGGGAGVGKNTRCEGGGDQQRNPSSFAVTASVLMQTKTRQNAKASFSNLQRVQIIPGQRALGPPASLCTHHLNFCGLQGGGAPKKF